MALDVGIAFDNMTAGKQGIDLLYLTSISFLFLITVAIVTALFSYNKSKLANHTSYLHISEVTDQTLFFFSAQTTSDQRREPVISSLTRQLIPWGSSRPRSWSQCQRRWSQWRRCWSGGPSPSWPSRDGFWYDDHPDYCLERHLEQWWWHIRLKSQQWNQSLKLALLLRQHEWGREQLPNQHPRPQEVSLAHGCNTLCRRANPTKVSLLNLSYYTKFGIKLKCHLCSFFEKISTGSNTDSDLRVVRFDGMSAKE